MPGSSSPTLRILCFGDSLTSGWFMWGLNQHPYSHQLQIRLREELPDVAVEVYTNGSPGEGICWPSWRERLQVELRKRYYDWVIMLGGTNDLALCPPKEQVLEGIRSAWSLPLAKGSRVLALTIPECAAKIERFDELRESVNMSILEFQALNLFTFDLKSKVPYKSLSKEDREKYWDDGLHMTEEGYNWMGNHIADAFLDILAHDTDLQESIANHAHDDAWDEEDGNPHHISQGYVVVRQKDLD